MKDLSLDEVAARFEIAFRGLESDEFSLMDKFHQRTLKCEAGFVKDSAN